MSFKVKLSQTVATIGVFIVLIGSIAASSQTTHAQSDFARAASKIPQLVDGGTLTLSRSTVLEVRAE